MPIAKKTTRKRRNKSEAPVLVSQDTNVNMRRAKNGYIVSSFGPKGDQTFVFRNKMEAKKKANQLLG
jgi:hypothetical protein